MGDIRDSQNRLGRAQGYGRAGDDEDDEEGIMSRGGARSMGSGRLRTAEQLNGRKEQRKRFQFEADEEDDRIEDELDDNLDEISDMTKRLKALGSAMGQELDNQNSRIERIDGKTGKLDGRINNNTARVSYLFMIYELHGLTMFFLDGEAQVDDGIPRALYPLMLISSRILHLLPCI